MTTAAVSSRAHTRRAGAVALARLWRPIDLALVLGGNVVGVMLILVGWWGSSDALSLHDSTNWLQVGIIGVIVAGVANGLFLVRARRAVGLSRLAVLGVPAPVRRDATSDVATVVALPGSTRMHLASCPMIAGKPATPVVAGAALRPCEVCRP
ncbi:MAG TPA: hypothetical protein VGJ14_17400 [Sporichthyaceae bacterium]|jgi:hypothetical protein